MTFRYMSLNERLAATRVITGCCLLAASVIGALTHVDYWGWFLGAGVYIYPSQINIDFREL